MLLHPALQRLSMAVATLLLLTPVTGMAAGQGFVQDLINQFADSDFVFQRSRSNVPFTPVAFIGTSRYAKTDATTPRGIELEYDVNSVSQMAGLPILLTERDALIIGEYLSWSDFDVTGNATESFQVGTIGLPVAWLRQVDPDWQVAAFLMPQAHNSSLQNSDWSFQTMGGTFARWTQSDQLWWAFGLYFDIAPDDDFYIPYVGASWTINQHWTLSAVMPWPAVLYAPDRDWLFKLGVSPSGASWAVNPRDGDVAVNFDAWDFGLTTSRRLKGNFWMDVEVGVGAFRGFRVSGSDVDEPETDVGASWFAGLEFNYRPSLR